MLTRGVADSTDSLKKAYLKLFLFRFASNHISIVESEFVSVILLKRMVSIFKSSAKPCDLDVKRVIRVFGNDYRGELGVISRLEKELKLTMDELLAKSISIFKIIKSEHLKPTAITEKHAIYALHKFVFSYLKIKNQQEASELLEKLHGGKTITSLFVFGDFPLVDFSDLTIQFSEFVNHGKLLMSQFNENTKFISCLFFGCADRYKKGRVPPHIFDETCRSDETFKYAISSLNSKADDSAKRVRTDVKSVLNSMRKGLGFSAKSINKIKISTRLADVRGYKGFLDEMCKINILQFDSDDALYRVSPEFEREALVLCDENVLDPRLSEAINNLVDSGV